LSGAPERTAFAARANTWTMIWSAPKTIWKRFGSFGRHVKELNSLGGHRLKNLKAAVDRSCATPSPIWKRGQKGCGRIADFPDVEQINVA